MVIKILAWGPKLAKKAAALGKYTPDMFVKCQINIENIINKGLNYVPKEQWQKTQDISIYYLVYRCIFACLFIVVMILSIAEPGTKENGLADTSPAYYFKWLIYLTHWGFTICTVQAIIGAVLVIKERFFNTDIEAMKMTCCIRVYWVLFNCSVCAAFTITCIYWTSVYVPGVTPVDVLNLCVHVGNSVFMLLDLMITSFPIRLIDFYWPLSFAVLYAIFNLIYYLAGGTDRKGNRYIYTIQDWSKPGKAVVVVLLSIMFLMVLHILLSFVTVGRRKLSERWCRQQMHITETRTTSVEGDTNEMPINHVV